MDDNIININILDFCKTDKIIFPYMKGVPFNNYVDNIHSWWYGKYGKIALSNYLNDTTIKYKIDKNYWLYFRLFLFTKKYLTDKLFTIFSEFYKHKVFFRKRRFLLL